MRIGKERTSPYLGEHIRHNVFGAVCPADGRLTALLFNLCDSETFQVFLGTLAQENPPVAGRRAILVLDNASLHKVKRLNWNHFDAAYLPARSPDLNAIERLIRCAPPSGSLRPSISAALRFWLRLKADWFNGWIAKTAAQLEERLITALQSLFAQPSILQI